MKEETQIAKENVNHYLENDEADVCKISCKEHKQTCQRWLDMLKSLVGILRKNHQSSMRIDEEMKDKEQAIKLYEENGI